MTGAGRVQRAAAERWAALSAGEVPRIVTRYGTVEQRFWSKIEFTPDGCWTWRGSINPGGYGSMNVRKRRTLVHRLAYEVFVGPIPEGLPLDHLCHKRACANPEHLEPVTPRENIMRGYAPNVTKARFNAQTHCKHGHEYTPENTRYNRKGRSCVTCNRKYALAQSRSRPRKLRTKVGAPIVSD